MDIQPITSGLRLKSASQFTEKVGHSSLGNVAGVYAVVIGADASVDTGLPEKGGGVEAVVPSAASVRTGAVVSALGSVPAVVAIVKYGSVGGSVVSQSGSLKIKKSSSRRLCSLFSFLYSDRERISIIPEKMNNAKKTKKRILTTVLEDFFFVFFFYIPPLGEKHIVH